MYSFKSYYTNFDFYNSVWESQYFYILDDFEYDQSFLYLLIKLVLKKNSHCVDISSIIKAIERIFTCLLAISMNRLFASFVQRFCSVCLF